ncbi:MAG: UbiD family decarboxylase [Clostridiaceae bacterium]|nr:UbiD family decarboxylase [Clostridiaceae bacterium]
MERQMLRSTLKKLEAMGKLEVCNVEVNPEYELGAVLKYYNNERPMLFNRVKNSKITVVGGLYGSREIFYDLMDTTHEDRIYQLMNAIANPKPTKLLKDGPIKENIITRNINLPKLLPIPKFHGDDSSTFITAGVMIIKDPDTGKTFTSVRRFQINGGNKISVLIASAMLKNQIEALRKGNKPLEMAVVLGYDAPYLLASQLSSQLYGVDKHQIDSALRGEALELVKCHTVDLEVPAYCECVLEGIIPPDKSEVEGPFGELMGYYGGVAPHPIMEVTAVLHRNNPIFQVAFPCREEHFSNGLVREMELYNDIKRLMDVKDVHITMGGGYRFHAIVSIHKKNKGEGKTAILAALGANKDLKHVVIVDEDIDIFNPDAVEGAIATRVQASKDMVVIASAVGSGLDPSHLLEKASDKMGIDATKPVGEIGKGFEMAKIPGYEKIDISKYL